MLPKLPKTLTPVWILAIVVLLSAVVYLSINNKGLRTQNKILKKEQKVIDKKIKNKELEITDLKKLYEASKNNDVVVDTSDLSTDAIKRWLSGFN